MAEHIGCGAFSQIICSLVEVEARLMELVVLYLTFISFTYVNII